MGEVSRVNDDHHGNFFLEPVGRFPGIEADDSPLHLLCTEYPAARRQNRLPAGPCREPP
ncbi:MAG: D-lyxose/D-mannose family sugar isomerase [Armatimonadetes bacterium]|nr:D-lyxose/D-mannose family sugar isomerase [Armatimonadota bacterium]